jgi:hypothetical protein
LVYRPTPYEQGLHATSSSPGLGSSLADSQAHQQGMIDRSLAHQAALRNNPVRQGLERRPNVDRDFGSSRGLGFHRPTFGELVRGAVSAAVFFGGAYWLWSIQPSGGKTSIDYYTISRDGSFTFQNIRGIRQHVGLGAHPGERVRVLGRLPGTELDIIQFMDRADKGTYYVFHNALIPH